MAKHNKPSPRRDLHIAGSVAIGTVTGTTVTLAIKKTALDTGIEIDRTVLLIVAVLAGAVFAYLSRRLLEGLFP